MGLGAGTTNDQNSGSGLKNQPHTERNAVNMDKIVGHWVERARYDLETAKAMLECQRYLYVAYMCQQAIEKIIKAIIAQQEKETRSIIWSDFLKLHNFERNCLTIS